MKLSLSTILLDFLKVPINWGTLLNTECIHFLSTFLFYIYRMISDSSMKHLHWFTLRMFMVLLPFKIKLRDFKVSSFSSQGRRFSRLKVIKSVNLIFRFE